MDTTLLWINVLLPILSIAIPVFATIYTVNNRIKNENKENHKPYLVLDEIEPLQALNKYSYYLIPIGRNYHELNEILDIEKIDTLDNKDDLNINLKIQNIGYGVATNIKFYNLLTGKQIYGSQQSTKDQNQKLFTTFDIASNAGKKMQARLVNHVIEEEGMSTEDHHRILCVYQDLNRNIYNFIISINVKKNNHYDFFAYQRSSHSYQRWIKENQANYKKIIKEYKGT